MKKHTMFFLLGLLLLCVGFYFLTLVDPRAYNIFGILAPVLIVGAYVLVGIGIIVK